MGLSKKRCSLRSARTNCEAHDFTKLRFAKEMYTNIIENNTMASIDESAVVVGSSN